MAYSEMPVHSIVEPDRGRVEDAWLQGVFFFFACVMTSSWGSIPEGGK